MTTSISPFLHPGKKSGASSLAACRLFFLGAPSSPTACLNRDQKGKKQGEEKNNSENNSWALRNLQTCSKHKEKCTHTHELNMELQQEWKSVSMSPCHNGKPLLSNKNGECCLWRFFGCIVEELQRHHL